MFGKPAGEAWIYDSTTHLEAINRLIYVAEQGEDFVLLMADRGAGKSTTLDRVRSQCRRLGYSTVSLNLAALDETAFLWQLCGGLSIAPAASADRSALMGVIREELTGRSLCGSRTVLLLDDLHLASGDLSLMLQFLGAINQQACGAVTVIATTEASAPAEVLNLSALKVRLPELDADEACDFVRGKLAELGTSSEQLTDDGLNAIINLAAGNTRQLTRICELLAVASSASEDLLMTSDVITALTHETLSV